MSEAHTLDAPRPATRVGHIAGDPRAPLCAPPPATARPLPLSTAHQPSQCLSAQEERALRFRLQNVKDELELFGWDPADLRRIVRQAKSALPLHDVVRLLQELLVEERAWYGQHTVLLDDQLDHTRVL